MNRAMNKRWVWGIWCVWLAAMMLCLGSLLAVVASADGEQSVSGEARVWTDSTGRFTVEAELVGVAEDRVTLKRVADGQQITLRTEQLSAADQQHLLGEQRGKTPAPTQGATAPPLAVAPFDAETARQHQEAWAEHLGVPVTFENSIGMKFVLIPPGEFDMGSTEDEVEELLREARARNLPGWYIERLPSEAPRHRVRITKPFWLGAHEVTRGQFRRFVNDRRYQTEAERDGKGGFGQIDGQWKRDPRFNWKTDLGLEQTEDHPVVNVTWNDVVAFCQWLSAKEGRNYRLPSEAQWEYACRAGTTTQWYGTDDLYALQEHAWFGANAEGRSHPVGQKLPNAWRLHDMHGNAREWCSDRYDRAYYANSPRNDPMGPARGSIRMHRGGNWIDFGSWCRSANRDGYEPSGLNVHLGFRVSLTSVGRSGE